MNESTEVKLAQVDACLWLFHAVQEAVDAAVARGDERCIDAAIWGWVLDAYGEVAEQWDW